MDQAGVIPQGGGEGFQDFSAILTPHRSLGRRGFLILIGFICAVSFTAGAIFFYAGAWPVLAFFGLDALLVTIAFKLNYRAARAYETVSIAGDTLTVTKVHASGRCNSWTFNPYWARVELAARPGRASRLLLSSHGRRLVLGNFLSEDERRDFAAALAHALAASKGQAAA